MYHAPEYSHSLSLRLSNVLDQIGLNEETVRKRRKVFLVQECLNTLRYHVSGHNITSFHFGSQTEGSTTLALQSDTDILVCDNRFNIIQDLQHWQRGYVNLLMIKDEDTPPGYCLLQKTYEDAPIPVNYAPDGKYVCDAKGRILMRNTWFVDNLPDGCIRNGPSQTTLGQPGFADQDIVHAFYCRSWPSDANEWLHKQSVGNLPSQKMRCSAVHDGCFLVPVGSRESLDDQFQWRISTSLTERTLMFGLNITQIRCYVLMKMILKSYINQRSERNLSSFMCKSVLLNRIENTNADFWRDNNLLSCLNSCLKLLYECVSFEHCPHFIIPGNNLMAGRFTPDVKNMLKSILHHIIQSEGRSLLEIDTDLLGQRLSDQFSFIQLDLRFLNPSIQTSGQLMMNFSLFLDARGVKVLSQLTHSSTEYCVQNLLWSIQDVAEVYRAGNENMQAACRFLSKYLVTSLGSILASYSISGGRDLSQHALVWFSTDMTRGISQRLKLASVFYSVGDIRRAEFILQNIEDSHSLDMVFSICGCYQHKQVPTQEFLLLSSSNEGTVVDKVAFCVRYLLSEIDCIPQELKQEFYRSDSDPQHRGNRGIWMDWAVVDSKPYLYFLQYKVYSYLGNPVQQQRALNNLAHVISTDPNLGHKETAFNLLGQCLEQENRSHDALNCYRQSIRVRPTNNAANIYIERVQSKINNSQ